jgi:RNA polymerase primary sigma factor
MYLREMGSVELLSREGEIAIAKRIEASREAMIAGLCESPLKFQAIIIWRDELNEGKVFLCDIIDLEATYAGPDAKAMPAPTGPDGQPIPQPVGAAPAPGGLAQTPAPPTAPASATPFKPASERANGEEAEGGETPPSLGRRSGMAHTRNLCFPSSFTVLACGPFSPISSANATCVPTARRLYAPSSTLFR